MSQTPDLTASECEDAKQITCAAVEMADADVVDCAQVEACPTDSLLASCDYTLVPEDSRFTATLSWYEGDGEYATCSFTGGICDALGGTFTCYSE